MIDDFRDLEAQYEEDIAMAELEGKQFISDAVQQQKEENHEIWRICNKCGNEWDAKIWGIKCPKCE